MSFRTNGMWVVNLIRFARTALEWVTGGGVDSVRQPTTGCAKGVRRDGLLIVLALHLLRATLAWSEESARVGTVGRASLDEVTEAGTENDADFPWVLRRFPEAEQQRELPAGENPTDAVNGAGAQIVPDRWRSHFLLRTVIRAGNNIRISHMNPAHPGIHITSTY